MPIMYSGGAGNIGSSQITDDSILDADIKSNAAISRSKLAPETEALTLFPYPNCPGITEANSGKDLGNNNTLMYLYQFVLPFPIIVNKISVKVNTLGSVGTWDISIYSENGQTKEISVTTENITVSNVIISTAVGSILLEKGIHWFALNGNGAAAHNFSVFKEGLNTAFTLTDGLPYDVASEPVLAGILSITADTPPATLTLANIVQNLLSDCAVIFRLDN